MHLCSLTSAWSEKCPNQVDFLVEEDANILWRVETGSTRFGRWSASTTETLSALHELAGTGMLEFDHLDTPHRFRIHPLVRSFVNGMS